MEKHEIVIIGAGHNGLIVAGYLTKAGLDVCVVESNDDVGGGVITKELTLPGFRHDAGSVLHGMMTPNPLIHRDELGLKSKYGLEYLFPDKPFAVIFPDDKALVFDRDIDKTCASISQFSDRDAEAYRKFHQAATQMLKIGSVAMYSPPPSWGVMMSVLDASEEGRDYLRTVFSSATDVADDWFENERVKIALARFASEVMVGPREKGTGHAMFFVASLHSWGWGLAVGGSGMLTKTLAAQIKDNGGTIKVSSPVRAIKVDKGKAKSVVLVNGDEIQATKAVVSNLNVKQLFLDLLEPEKLPAGLPDKVRQIKPASFSALHQAVALNEAPTYKAGEDVNNALLVECALPSMEEFLRAFDEYVYGIPNTKMPLMVTATRFDPSRAPEGKHTLYLYHYQPYKLKDGGPGRWKDIKQDIADDILETVREHTTNMGADNVLGRWTMSPLEMEQCFPSMLAGDISHIGQFMNQFFAYRPLPGLGHYRTPINRLYMCGNSTHPGFGVAGGGRATVQVIMEDLGIDFKKVIEK